MNKQLKIEMNKELRDYMGESPNVSFFKTFLVIFSILAPISLMVVGYLYHTGRLFDHLSDKSSSETVLIFNNEKDKKKTFRRHTGNAPKATKKNPELIYSWMDQEGIKRYSNIMPPGDGNPVRVQKVFAYDEAADRRRELAEKRSRKIVRKKEHVVLPAFTASLPHNSISSEDNKELTGDYGIDVTVFQRNDTLYFRGRVDSGPLCDRLRLGLVATCENGRQVHLSTFVDDVGGSGSRLIDAQRRVGKMRDRPFPRWNAEVLSVQCMN